MAAGNKAQPGVALALSIAFQTRDGTFFPLMVERIKSFLLHFEIASFTVSRREVKFHCCENNYTLLEFKLHIQRKPLFYLVNLIIPTSIIS